MGEVYLAEDIRLKRSVAIKVLPPSLTDDGERVRRFRNPAPSHTHRHSSVATFALPIPSM